MRFPCLLGTLVFCILSGCGTQAVSNQPTPVKDFLEAFNCEAILIYTESPITCGSGINEGILLQTPSTQQFTIYTSGLSLSFDSTIYVNAVPSDRLIVSTIDGISAISANNITQVIQPGAEVTVFLKNGLQAASPPSAPHSIDFANLQQFDLENLPRPVELPSPIQGQIIISGEPETGCTAPEGWVSTYTIQRGDTLSRVAALHSISIEELQTANCILDPNRISPGQGLAVPFSATDIPSNPVFYADHETVIADQCTILHWSNEEARLVYYQGEAVARTDSREVCPQITTTYTLLILSETGEQTGYTATITVNPSP